MTQVAVGRRFNGPATSANGGYACGIAAGFIDGPAEVALRAPVPLDTPLDVEEGEEGGVVLRAGELVVATARPALEPIPQPPVRPSIEEARAAVREHGWRDRPEVFAGCYVCSPDRPDGLGVDFGRLPGHPQCTAALLVAGEDVPLRDGAVAPEVVWGALDCPSYTPHLWELERPSMLARMRAELLAARRGRLGQRGRRLAAAHRGAQAQHGLRPARARRAAAGPRRGALDHAAGVVASRAPVRRKRRSTRPSASTTYSGAPSGPAATPSTWSSAPKSCTSEAPSVPPPAPAGSRSASASNRRAHPRHGHRAAARRARRGSP